MKVGDMVIVRMVYNTPIPWPPVAVSKGGSKDAWARFWEEVQKMGFNAVDVLEGDGVLIGRVVSIDGDRVKIRGMNGDVWVPMAWVRPVTRNAIRAIDDPKREG